MFTEKEQKWIMETAVKIYCSRGAKGTYENMNQEMYDCLWEAETMLILFKQRNWNPAGE